METISNIASNITLIVGLVCIICLGVVILITTADKIINFVTGWNKILTWYTSHKELQKRPKAVLKSLADKLRDEADAYRGPLQLFVDAYPETSDHAYRLALDALPDADGENDDGDEENDDGDEENEAHLP